MYDQLILSSKNVDDLDDNKYSAPPSHDVAADISIEESTKQLVIQQLRLPGTTDPLLSKNFDEVYDSLTKSTVETSEEEQWYV